MGNRGDQVVGEILKRIHDAIRELDVSYDEYAAAKQWLIDVGQAGEWPLFLDVFVEHAVEAVAFRDRAGSAGTILGPYYLPDAPVLDAPYELPRRPDEAGEPLLFTGRVTSSDGSPLAGAELDVWHADAEGLYSGFDPTLPEGILRGKVLTGEDGRFEVRSVVPAPYTVPHDGPTGQMIAACGWHPWRPAHIHLLVTAGGHQMLTTQLYMGGDQYIDDDVADAVKPDLIVELQRRDADPERGMPEPYLHFDYDFQLAEAQTPAAVA